MTTVAEQPATEKYRPKGVPLDILSAGVTNTSQPASIVPLNLTSQLVKSFSVYSLGVDGKLPKNAKFEIAVPNRLFA